MRTKEAILSERLKPLDPNEDSFAGIMAAMDEFAKEIAIDFRNWCSRNSWISYTTNGVVVSYKQIGMGEGNIKTCDELFDLYQQETSSLK